MKSFLLWSVSISFLILISLQSVYSQTIVPGGYVSGIWTAAGSPYLIQGYITIHADSTLIIEPGVVVDFQGNDLWVFGSLQAIGTVTDSIYFFGGIIYIQHSSTDFSYCGIHSGSGVISIDSRVDISNCQISDNNLPEGGGLVISDGSHVTVSNSSILRNSALVRGAGISVRDGSYLDISNSTISYNHLYDYDIDEIGGGIHAYSIDTLIVTNCIFSNNSAGPLIGNYSKGGAIGVEPWPSGGSGYVNISQCTFLDNSADYGGGAIYMDSCTAVLNHNYFKGNSSIIEGVALSVENSSVQVSHNIFDRNIRLQGGVMNGVVLIGDSSSALFDHCNFYGNGGAFSDKIFILSGTSSLDMKNTIFSQHPSAFTMQFFPGSQVSVEYSNFYNSAANFIGSVPTGLGTISGVNANDDPCDPFHNIFLDPLFANPDSGDFHLSWANWPVADSTKSPCIDAGDPASPPDPDSTITDIGVFSFDQSSPSEVAEEILAPSEYELYQNYPNPFNPSTKISWQSPVSSWQTLKVYNILGREVATLVNDYKPAGNYEVEFDASNLPSGIYFYRLKAGSFVQTKKMILLK